MDQCDDLIKWLRKMGYDGNIPKTLNIIYRNDPTIWGQLMQNARPRQEVHHIRNNIIINRLKSKPISKQDEFPYPIKEIALYQKKMALERKVKNLRATIKEKENINTHTSQNIKMQSIAIEKLSEKIKLSQEREFILRKKFKIIEGDIQSAEENLKSLENMTPVELGGKQNTEEITQILEKCTRILEEQMHFAPLPVLKKIQKQNHTLQQTRSTEKSCLRDRSTYEHYLNMAEKKLPAALNSAINSGKTIKELSSDPQTKELPKKRESFGLLPVSFISSPKPEDFLVAVDSPMKMMSMVEEHSMEVHESHLFTKNVSTLSKSTVKSEDNSKKLHENKVVSNLLMELLHRHNRQLIWKVFQSLEVSMHTNILDNLIQNRDTVKQESKINQTDIAHLQFLHVHTELKVLKLKAMLKHLKHQVEMRKKNIHVSIPDELFELMYKGANLDSTLTTMKRELAAAKMSQEKDIDLLFASEKLRKLEENIAMRSSSIRKNMKHIREVFASINRTRREFTACINNLLLFIDDMSWASPLLESRHSEEMRVFQKFPLEYMRRCIHTNTPIYYRDLCISNFPEDHELDDQTLYILSEALENPLSFPEVVVFDILKAIYKLNILKSMQRLPEVSQPKKDTLEGFQAQESYVQSVIDGLASILHSPSTKKTLVSSSDTKKVMDIWLEMPLKNFISSKIKVDGYPYSFYEKQYDKFYKDL